MSSPGPARLLNDLETARRAHRLYPPGHPALDQALVRLGSACDAFGDSAEHVLALAPETTLWDGEPFSMTGSAPARRLVELLFQAGIAAVRLSFPAARTGSLELAGILARLTEPPTEEDREILLAEAAGIDGIDLRPIDLGLVHVAAESAPAENTGTLLIWNDLALLLGARRTGAGVVAGQGPAPELILQRLTSDSDPGSVFDQLFGDLAASLPDEPTGRAARLADLRSFLADLLDLLDPDRRHLAVVMAGRHLPLTDSADRPLLPAEILVVAVESLLQREIPVPGGVRAALAVIATSGLVGADGDLADRAAVLLGRLDGQAIPEPPPADAPFDLQWRDTALSEALGAAVTETSLRTHLNRLLGEVVMIWPDAAVTDAASLRLAEGFVDAIEVGELEAARRIAPLLAASRSQPARRYAAEEGLRAASRVFPMLGAEQHPELVAILSSLGPAAIPHLIQAIVAETDTATRKRLLETVLRFGSRAIPHVRPLLDDERWYVVRNAVMLLRRLDDRDSAGRLMQLLDSADPRLTEEILKALVAFEHPGWLTALTSALRATERDRAEAAAEVAGHIRHPAVIRALAEQLRDLVGGRLRDPRIPILIRALGRSADPAALPILAEIAGLRQWRYTFSVSPLRQAATTAIAAIPGPQARSLVARLAEDRDPEVAAVAASLLDPAGGRSAS